MTKDTEDFNFGESNAIKRPGFGVSGSESLPDYENPEPDNPTIWGADTADDHPTEEYTTPPVTPATPNNSNETEYVDAEVRDVEEESDGYLSGKVSRRAILAGAATGAGALGVAAILSGGSEEEPAAPAGALENPNEYIWSSESELLEATEEELCYNGPGSENYFGAVSAEEVESMLSDHVNGEDSTGLLTDEEKSYGFDDITPHQGAYAVNTGRKLDSDGNHGGLFVELKGEEDEEGVMVTREGAVELAENVDYQEVWNTCN